MGKRFSDLNPIGDPLFPFTDLHLLEIKIKTILSSQFWDVQG